MSEAHRFTGDYKQRGLNAHRLGEAREVSTSPILDVGCGGGSYVDELGEDYEVVGIDILEYSNRSRIVRGDATVLPFKDDSFSTVLLFEVLEHLDDPGRCLREIKRVATDSLLLSVPNAVDPSIFEATGVTMHPFVDPTHVNFYDETGICQQLEEEGYTVERVQKINRVHPGILFLHFLGLPDSLSTRIGRRLSSLPWTKQYYMTLLVKASLAE